MFVALFFSNLFNIPSVDNEPLLKYVVVVNFGAPRFPKLKFKSFYALKIDFDTFFLKFFMQVGGRDIN
jgi:hypothetical protein